MLVAVRQVVIVAEKIRLADDLEGQVHERTAQLQEWAGTTACVYRTG